jgi:hypothetical protein
VCVWCGGCGVCVCGVVGCGWVGWCGVCEVGLVWGVCGQFQKVCYLKNILELPVGLSSVTIKRS